MSGKPERVDVECRPGTKDVITRAMVRESRFRSKAQFVDEAIWRFAQEILQPKYVFNPGSTGSTQAPNSLRT